MFVVLTKTRWFIFWSSYKPINLIKCSAAVCVSDTNKESVKMKNMGMDNTTTNSMDMNMMSGGHHAPADDHTSMKNYFHLSAQAIILFTQWETMTWIGKYTLK